MTEEPTVLDYVKSWLTPWKGQPLRLPPVEPVQEGAINGELTVLSEPLDLELPSQARPASVVSIETSVPASDASVPADELLRDQIASVEAPAGALSQRKALPWPAWLALVLALLAQWSLNPAPQRSWKAGLIIYLLAAAWMAWAYWRGDWSPVPMKESESRRDPLTVRWLALLGGMVVMAVAFFALTGNRFTVLNLCIWLLAMLALSAAFWLPNPSGNASLWSQLARITAWLRKPQWRVALSRSAVFVLAIVALVIFFRVNRFIQIPSEMVSDQAEKLLDVIDVLNGQTSIFFARNTGREAVQFYLTAWIAKYLGTGPTFTSLKIGTILAGLLTLPYIYLLGKEVGNRWTGLAAFFFAGIAYWPNVLSRIGLRFPFYFLFAAPTLYYLIRALRTNNRNDFILTGLALGLGLHGYTPFRIMPFVVVIAVGLFLLHRQARGVRKQTLLGLAVVTLISFVVFLPLLRYWQENPEVFQYRAFTRLSTIETPLPAPAGEVFLNNLWRAMTMYAWDDGNIWVISVTGRPALDTVSSALFYLGMALLFVRYLRKRHWLDLFLILAVPLMMMPSILSLAFPDENPAVNRASGAMIPVFLIVAIALQGLLSVIKSRLGGAAGLRVAWGVAIVLGGFACLQNYDLVFNQYRTNFDMGAWNTGEMGQVIRDFADSVGSLDSAWVMAYPYWVDTRLVGMNAGNPTRDYAVWPEGLPQTLVETRTKLFIVNLADQNGLGVLRSIYPNGVLSQYKSRVNKDFWLYLVPGVGETPAELVPIQP